MSLWEYKVITSGKGGFATPALLEKFLNDLGRDEWEIIHFQTPPDNFLAFTGLVRRSTQRDWTLEDAAAAAAKAEAEKLRAEFEAKFKAAASSTPAGGAEERAPSFLEEKAAPDDGFRKLVDTSHDDDPDAQEEEKADEWDKLTAAEEDELPTFFEAIKPHMRRNQRGPGMSVGVDYLAKKWDQSEDDLKGALMECGFVVPADEDTKPEYLEYDGDLFWLNINRRGELWINTKEKPRPVFRPVKAQKVAIEEEAKPAPAEARAPRGEEKSQKPENGNGSAEGESRREAPPQAQRQEGSRAQGGAPLPEGPALLDKIRPHMRRNRRGPGGSGSTSFLSRALRTNEADLRTAFSALGLTMPASAEDKPVYSEIAEEFWWLNLDSRGGLWINGREKKPGETLASANESAQSAPLESAPGSAGPDAVPAPEVVPSIASGSEAQSDPAATSAASAPSNEAQRTESTSPREESVQATASESKASEAAPAPERASNPVLAGVRLFLKETRTGAIAAKADRVAEEMGKSVEDLLATLVSAGLKLPEKPREKPVFVEHAGEIFWLNKNTKGELWLNAKASKFADREEHADEGGPAGEAAPSAPVETEKKPARRPIRSRGKKSE